MPQTVPNDWISLILSHYTCANRALQQGQETVHIALDYASLLHDIRCGLLSHAQIAKIAQALAALLEQDWQIPSTAVDVRQMQGEIRLHVVGYYFLHSRQCAVIDLNVLRDGRVRDRRGWINFLSRTVFQLF